MAQYLPGPGGRAAPPRRGRPRSRDARCGDATQSRREGLRRLSRRLDVLAWDRFSRRRCPWPTEWSCSPTVTGSSVERLGRAMPVESIPIAVDCRRFRSILAAPIRRSVCSSATISTRRTPTPLCGCWGRSCRACDGSIRRPARSRRRGSHRGDDADVGRRRVAFTAPFRPSTPHLDAAAVVVAPIRIGGGIRVKVLEALAAGKAVVASPRAIEGLGVTPDARCSSRTRTRRSARRPSRCSPIPRDEPSWPRARASWAERNLDHASVVAAYERLYGELRSQGANRRVWGGLTLGEVL